MFVIRRALGAKEIRPVSILETRAGLTEPTFRTVAPFALSAEALLKRFGGGGRQGVLMTSGQMSNSILMVLSTSIERQSI